MNMLCIIIVCFVVAIGGVEVVMVVLFDLVIG